MAKNYKEAFEIEKKCKNEAYFFILENGLIEQFAEWKKRNPGAQEQKPIERLENFLLEQTPTSHTPPKYIN